MKNSEYNERYYNQVKQIFDYLVPFSRIVCGSDYINFGYWERGAKNLHEAQEAFSRLFAEKCTPTRYQNVLDLGCGQGGNAIFLAKHYGCSVTGLDLIEKQLAIGQQKVQKMGLGGLVAFIRANALSMPFESAEHFDICYTIESLLLMDRECAIKEIHRVLASNGIYMGVDFLSTNHTTDEQRVRFESAFRVKNLITMDAFTKLLKKKCFKVIETIDLKSNAIKGLVMHQSEAKKKMDILIEKLGKKVAQRLVQGINVMENLMREDGLGYYFWIAKKK